MLGYFCKVNKRIILAILLLCSTASYAGKLSKAFEALNIYNYFEAKRLFESGLKKDSVGNGYGLSVIYSRNDNPFYQPDSALKFVLLSERQFLSLEEKRKSQLLELGIDSNQIQDQKQRVSDLFFRMAVDSMTTDEFNRFILGHPWYNKMATAVLVRDSLAFEDALSISTWRSFKYFIETYPNAIQKAEAIEEYDWLFYFDHTRDSTLKQFLEFERQNDKSPYVRDAQDMIYKLSVRTGSEDSYYNFIQSNPENPNVDKAWKVLYEMSVTRNDPLQIANFILDYPDYPFRKEALMDYSLSNDKFYPFQHANKWGFINSKGEETIEPEFDWVEQFSEGAALVGKADFSGYINKRGEVTIPIEFDDGGGFSNGYAWIEKNELYGLVNTYGRLALPIEYENIGSFSEGRLVAEKGGLSGFYDEDLRLVIPFHFESASEFKNGRSIVSLKGKYGVINDTGGVVVPFECTEIVQITDSLFRVTVNDTMGLLSLNGDTIVSFNYDFLGSLSEGLLVAASDGKYGYIKLNGEIAIPSKFDFTAMVQFYGQVKLSSIKYMSKGKFGLVDTTGKKLYPAIFEDVGAYGKITPVKKRGKWGFADENVKLKIQYKYTFASALQSGYSRVQLNERWGLINSNGDLVLPIEYEQLEYFLDDYILVNTDGKTGLLDMDLKEVLPIEFNYIQQYDEKYVLLKREAFRAYFNLNTGKYLFKEQGF